MSTKRHTVAGSPADDPAALALGSILDAASNGELWVFAHDVPAAEWRPSNGGWVIVNKAWGVYADLPHDMRLEALAMIGAIGDSAMNPKRELRRVLRASFFVWLSSAEPAS